MHVHILEYLAECNRYSNTTLAVSEFLGQTKGTMSQSLKLLEEKEFLAREADLVDRRVVRLSLTTSGKQLLQRIRAGLPRLQKEDKALVNPLRSLLRTWQKDRGYAAFGLCYTCKYNLRLEGEQFRCGLTGEDLKEVETKKICREHA